MVQVVIVYAQNDEWQISKIIGCDHDLPHNRQHSEQSRENCQRNPTSFLRAVKGEGENDSHHDCDYHKKMSWQ